MFYLDLQGRHTDDFHCALVNFHDFTALKTLEISRALLFLTVFEEGGEHVVEPSHRNDLYMRLPPKLEELKASAQRSLLLKCSTEFRTDLL